MEYPNEENFVKNFTKKNYKRKVRVTDDGVTKREGDIPYVKWKNSDNSFSSWIAKKDIFI